MYCFPKILLKIYYLANFALYLVSHNTNPSYLSLTLNFKQQWQTQVCILPFTFLLLILHFLFSQASKNPDLEPLLAFKASTDKANKFTTWNSTTKPLSAFTLFFGYKTCWETKGEKCEK